LLDRQRPEHKHSHADCVPILNGLPPVHSHPRARHRRGFVPNGTNRPVHGSSHGNSDDSRFHLTYRRSVYRTEPGLAMVDLAGGHRTRILQLSVTGCAPGDIHSRYSEAEGGAVTRGACVRTTRSIVPNIRPVSMHPPCSKAP
jgi:hypothetical protein